MSRAVAKLVGSPVIGNKQQLVLWTHFGGVRGALVYRIAVLTGCRVLRLEVYVIIKNFLNNKWIGNKSSNYYYYI